MIVALYEKATGRLLTTISASSIDMAEFETSEIGTRELLDPIPPVDVPIWFRVDHPVEGAYELQLISEARDARYTWDWTTHTYIPDIARASAAAKARIFRGRDLLKYGNFTWDGHEFLATTSQRGLISSYATEALIAQVTSGTFSTVWTLADDSAVTLDGPDMLAVFGAMQAHTREADDQSAALLADIETAAAITPALDAVNALALIEWVDP